MPSITNTYNWEVNECNRDNVGYSMDYRNQQTVNGITYYDCSSYQWYGLLNGGFDVVGANGSAYPFTTSNMGSVLEKLGFTRYNATSVEWKKGDIVWREGHCEMVYEGQRTMGAHSSTYELKDQVSINVNESNKNSYTYLYRYSENPIPPTPEPIPLKKRKMPVWLMCARKYH